MEMHFSLAAVVSSVIHASAVLLILVLVRRTERRIAWMLSSATLAVIMLANTIVLPRFVFPFFDLHDQCVFALIPLTASFFLLGGMLTLDPLFRTLTASESALREKEDEGRLLFKEMSAGFALHEIICDSSGKCVNYRFLDVNPAFEQITGMKRSSIVGKQVLDIMPDLEQFWIDTYGDVALTGRQVHFEHYSKPLDKHFAVTAYSPGKGRFAAMFSDITAVKRAEEERSLLESKLHHAQKLESLGVLAGGIAHDFNNLLMGILGNADLALSDLAPSSPGRDYIMDIEKTARRAADLCRQMLAYSGKGKFVIEPLDISSIVREMGHMLRLAISKKVIIKYNCRDNLPFISADATQMRQVVMNLTINASEAMGSDEGVISISTGVVECDADYIRQAYLDSLKPGTYVYVEISDTGCGMDENTRDKLFEPFFTTKFTGRGLGMAAVLGIVRGHNGTVKVYSEQGKGSTFKVLLPVCRVNGTTPDKPSKPPTPWCGKGTVMIVDDEETALTVIANMLKHMGFAVIKAHDGREAADIFLKRSRDIACVILDMTMPHMDGEETFSALRKVRPDVRVLLSSGYNEQDVTQRFVGKGLAGFIQKPYTASQLAEKLQAIMRT